MNMGKDKDSGVWHKSGPVEDHCAVCLGRKVQSSVVSA